MKHVWSIVVIWTLRSPSYLGKSLSTFYKYTYLKLFSNVDMTSDVITYE